MSATATPGVRPGVDPADYAQAITNMLEDLSLERERMQESQRATVNILEDFAEDKAWLEKSQNAILNILDDAYEEKVQLQDNQKALLNILEDLEDEREKIRRLNAELEDRVRRRTGDLERSNRKLEAFTYSVAHDLRAPLRAMCGFSEALLEEYGEGLGETGRGYAERVCNASRRMATLIDDLLNLARLSRAKLHREPVDLSELARAIVADLQAGEPERRAVVEVEDGINARVDRGLFRTVLENLLNNAWKFSAGRDETRIEVRGVATADGSVGFFVRDNGVGFDSAYADKLFQPFERLHSGDEYPGNGVGLASARQVVERHGGTISADAAVGRGAIFYVTISSQGQGTDDRDEP